MSFGVTRDWFAFADTNFEVQSSSASGNASNAQAVDSNGDVACETVFDTGIGYEVTYSMCSGSALPAGFKGGNVIAYDTNTNILITGGSVSTSGTEFPTFTVTGETLYGTASGNLYDFQAEVSVSGAKTAQAIGFIADTNTKASSSSVTFSASVAKVQDSQGQTVCMDVYGGRIEASGELISCTAIAGAAADTANGWALSSPVSTSEENTGYGSGSINVFENLASVTTTTGA